MNSLFKINILNEVLYNDIQRVYEQDNKYNTTFLTSSVFGLMSYLANNRIFLEVGNEEPISTGLMLVNIGNSGSGKSFSQKIVNNVLEDITIENNEKQLILNDFAKACNSYSDTEEYKNAKLNANTHELQTNFCSKYYYQHMKSDTRFELNKLKFSPIPEKMPQFYVKDFTSQALPDLYKTSPRNALYVYCDEITDIDEKITQTQGAKNVNAFKLNLIDGGLNIVNRKHDSPIVSRGYCNIVANSTPTSFQKYYTPEFFGSGLGYRCFFCIDTSTNDDNSKYIIKYHEEDKKHIKTYKDKIEHLIKYYVDIVDASDNINFKIILPELIDLFNSELMKVFNTELKEVSESGKLSPATVSELKDRIKTNVLKCILTLHLLNHSYGKQNIYFYSETDSMSSINADSILRGFEAYKVFLENSINILSGNISVTKLTPKMQKVVELLEVGEIQRTTQLLNSVLVKKVVSKTVFYEYLNNPEFCKSIEWNKHKETVRRLK